MASGARLVDAAVGADEPVVSLGNQHGAHLPDHALRLAQDQLNDGRLFLPLFGVLPRERRHLDGGEVEHLPLGLGDDLGCDNHDIARFNSGAGYRRRGNDHRCEVGAVFDLGRYPSGATRSREFTRPGIVKVFCHIHSHMSAVVRVFEHPWFTIPDEEGEFSIDGVPAGDRTLVAWHERIGERRDRVTIRPGQATTISFTLPVLEPAK